MTTELRRLRNYIDGEFRRRRRRADHRGGQPGHGRGVRDLAAVRARQDVDAAMAAAAARRSRPGATATPAERQQALLKIADAFEARAEELIAAESENTGKPIGR